ncbi:MAG: hypothetical protein F6K17_15125 [Okeania sp. SIO3C4]|nr:hypothetical protein [Okeania sp. SIO3B3]NER03856.1 hypothetical protein [Okeania sp. SIO3C4]
MRIAIAYFFFYRSDRLSHVRIISDRKVVCSRACNCWLKSGIIYKNLGLSVYATWTSY